MRRPLLWIATLLLSACVEDSVSTNTRAGMTQRQKDSITATLPLPGARIVGSALIAADSASTRAALIDSASQ